MLGIPERGTISLSILDLAPIVQDGNAAQAFRSTLDLAQHAERWGYHRYWLAEHHNIPRIASAATSVLIGYVAGGTSTMRIGSGGIMLPNHSPLVIAEQFGTLESLYPGRIDLGLGRAPGTNLDTAQALRPDHMARAESFPQDVQELQGYFRPVAPGQALQAVPAAGLDIPIWILGSSLTSAHLAAALGLPFAFASHFAPNQLLPAIEVYRSQFQPSEALDRPYVMLAVTVIAADTDAEARRLFTSLQQQFINVRHGRSGLLQPPLDQSEGRWSEIELASLERVLKYAFVGSRETVQSGLQAFIDETSADELLVTTQIYDHAALLRSYEIVAELRGTLTHASDDRAAA